MYLPAKVSSIYKFTIVAGLFLLIVVESARFSDGDVVCQLNRRRVQFRSKWVNMTLTDDSCTETCNSLKKMLNENSNEVQSLKLTFKNTFNIFCCDNGECIKVGCVNLLGSKCPQQTSSTLALILSKKTESVAASNTDLDDENINNKVDCEEVTSNAIICNTTSKPETSSSTLTFDSNTTSSTIAIAQSVLDSGRPKYETIVATVVVVVLIAGVVAALFIWRRYKLGTDSSILSDKEIKPRSGYHGNNDAICCVNSLEFENNHYEVPQAASTDSYEHARGHDTENVYSCISDIEDVSATFTHVPRSDRDNKTLLQERPTTVLSKSFASPQPRIDDSTAIIHLQPDVANKMFVHPRLQDGASKTLAPENPTDGAYSYVYNVPTVVDRKLPDTPDSVNVGYQLSGILLSEDFAPEEVSITRANVRSLQFDRDGKPPRTKPRHLSLERDDSRTLGMPSGKADHNSFQADDDKCHNAGETQSSVHYFILEAQPSSSPERVNAQPISQFEDYFSLDPLSRSAISEYTPLENLSGDSTLNDYLDLLPEYRLQAQK